MCNYGDKPIYKLMFFYILCIIIDMFIDIRVTMEVKREADSNDIAECSHDDKPTGGMFVFPLSRNIYDLCDFFTLSEPNASVMLNMQRWDFELNM